MSVKGNMGICISFRWSDASKLLSHTSMNKILMFEDIYFWYNKACKLKLAILAIHKPCTWSLRHLKDFQGISDPMQFPLSEARLCVTHCSNISWFRVWTCALDSNQGCLWPKTWSESRLLYRRIPSIPLKLVSQWREASPALQCCPDERPQKPSIPLPACVCVYGLKNNTALTVNFTQSNGTKCLSELAFGTTRYNPIKRFTAKQCSSLARSLGTGIKKPVLHFQEWCQEQSLHSRLGWAGLICAADGVVGLHPQAQHWLLVPFRGADSQEWLGDHQSTPQIPLPWLWAEEALWEPKTSEVKVVLIDFSANRTMLCPDSITLNIRVSGIYFFLKGSFVHSFFCSFIHSSNM